MNTLTKLTTAALLAVSAVIPATAEGTFSADSLIYQKNQTVGDASITIDIKCEYPTGTNTALVNATRRWIAEVFTDSEMTKGYLDAVEGRAFVDRLGKYHLDEALGFFSEPDSYYFPVEYTADFGVLYQSDKVVTMKAMIYRYDGGAHGITAFMLQSFDAETGARLSADDIFAEAHLPKVIGLVKKALAKQYFQVSSLTKEVVFDPSAIELPSVPPAFTAKGILFQYQPYEIAVYAYGAPECTVPYSALRFLMTPEANKLAPETRTPKSRGTQSRQRSHR